MLLDHHLCRTEGKFRPRWEETKTINCCSSDRKHLIPVGRRARAGSAVCLVLMYLWRETLCVVWANQLSDLNQLDQRLAIWHVLVHPQSMAKQRILITCSTSWIAKTSPFSHVLYTTKYTYIGSSNDYDPSLFIEVLQRIIWESDDSWT